MSASTEVKLDALPYFDQEYDQPGAREAVSHERQRKFSIPVNAHHALGHAPGWRRDEALQAYKELFRVFAAT